MRRTTPPLGVVERAGRTRVALAARHRDPANHDGSSLAAFRQRCPILHDRDEHLRRRPAIPPWRALGDLFTGSQREA